MSYGETRLIFAPNLTFPLLFVNGHVLFE